jgi:hypothetical protein
MLYIGTDMGVFRMPEDGKEWKLFNEGMPYVSVNELEYVPITGYLNAATWGRGLWQVQLKEVAPAIKPKINRSGNYELYYDNCFEQSDTAILYNIDKQPDYKYIWSTGDTTDTIRIVGITWGTNFTIFRNDDYYLIGIAPNGIADISDTAHTINIDTSHHKEDSVTFPSTISLTRNLVCVGDTVKYQVICKWNGYHLYWTTDIDDTTAYHEMTSDTTIVEITSTKPIDSLDLHIVAIRDCNCKARTSSIPSAARFIEPPPTPTITQYGNILVCKDEARNWQWIIDNDSSEIIEKNYIEITKAGVYKVMIRNEAFCTAVSDAYVISEPIDQVGQTIRAKLYPNPNSGVFILEMFYDGQNGERSDVELNIYDVRGDKVEKIDSWIGTYFNMQLDVAKYASGSYNLEIKINGNIKTMPFIIQH